jgi:GntR family transcriptional regulator, vanillate catabolism transcriptional regulator
MQYVKKGSDLHGGGLAQKVLGEHLMKADQNQVERVVLELRRLIMAGEFPPDARIAEVPISERLGVSRTPVRLALSELEQEGLLISRPRRGFVVRKVTVQEIVQAIRLQGVLEGLACAIIAEQGLSIATRIVLEECIDEGDKILSRGKLIEGDISRWSVMNHAFHGALVSAAQNMPLADAIEFNGKRPFVGARTLYATTNTLPLAFERMKSSQEEHRDLVRSLRDGASGRAEALMREHAVKSSEALQLRFKVIKEAGDSHRVPGLRLVVGQ